MLARLLNTENMTARNLNSSCNEYTDVIDQGTGSVGLSFFSENNVEVGSFVEILIPTPTKATRFICKVICVRAIDENYQIGLWFLSQSDSPRNGLNASQHNSPAWLR